MIKNYLLIIGLLMTGTLTAMDVKITQQQGSELRLAAATNNVHKAKLLLEKKAQIDAIMEKGLTPLHIAAVNGHEEMVKLLLKAQANTDAITAQGLTPLYFAATNGSHEVAQLLLKAQANTDANTAQGITPLHLAAVYGHTQVAEILINAQADINAITAEGFTPLHMTVKAGNKAIAELLITSRANIDAITPKGFTCLHLAALGSDKPDTALYQYLVERGANKNSQAMGFTPLQTAAIMDKKIHVCARCNNKALNKCSKCLYTYYCSPECQKAAWPLHKKDCKPLIKHYTKDVTQTEDSAQ